MTTEAQATNDGATDIEETGLTAVEQAIIDAESGDEGGEEGGGEEGAGTSDTLSAEERASLTTAELAAIDADEDEVAAADDANPTPEQVAAADTQAQADVVAAVQEDEIDKDLPEVDTSALIEIAERIGTNTAELQTISTELDELAQKYDDGDIAQGAYDRQKAKLESKERSIQSAIDSDTNAQRQIVDKDTQRSAILSERYEKQFNDYSTAFLALPENQIFVTDQAARLKLQETINRMGESGMSDGLTAKQTIDAARAHVAISLQLPPPVVLSQDKPKGKGRQTPIAVPPSVAAMSAVMGNGVDVGEFAHLDKLSGLAYETALSKMSESARERYFNG